MISFHSLSLLIRSSSVLAVTTRSSVYNNSRGTATLNSLDTHVYTCIHKKYIVLKSTSESRATYLPTYLGSRAHTGDLMTRRNIVILKCSAVCLVCHGKNVTV